PNSTDFGSGTTDLEIDAVIKDHAFLKNKKLITLPRYLPPEDKKYKFLVFCDVFKDKLDPYRGVAIRVNSNIAKYLAGALQNKDKAAPVRLRYFFDYPASDDLEISNDVYNDYGSSDYKDFRIMPTTLPDKTVAAWLQAPRTPAIRIDLYSSMLAHSSKEP